MRTWMTALPVLAGALASAACMPQMPEVPTEQVRRNVAIETVKLQLIEVTVKLPVTLKPREEIELRASVAGTILELPFEDGQVVAASPIPPAKWIECDEYLQATAGATPGDDACLYRNLAFLDGLKPFALIDDRAGRVNFRDAQAQYDAAVRALNRLLNYKDSSEASIDGARTAVLTARAACDRLRHQIEDCLVVSPRAGVLVKRLRRAGEYVNGGELLGTVAVLDPLVAELFVPEAHKHAVREGQELGIEIESVKDALGKPAAVAAKVRLCDPVAHAQTHSFRIEADIENPDFKLPAGVFGTTRLTVYRNEAGMRVPLTALKLRGERVSVFVVTRENTAREIEDISIGRVWGEWAEVLGDKLKPGDRLVVAGTQLLAIDDPVEIREDPTATVAAAGARDGRP